MAQEPDTFQDHLFKPTVPEVFNAFKEYVAIHPIPPSFLEHLQEDRLPFYWQSMVPAGSHGGIVRSIQAAEPNPPSDAAVDPNQARPPLPPPQPHPPPPSQPHPPQPPPPSQPHPPPSQPHPPPLPSQPQPPQPPPPSPGHTSRSGGRNLHEHAGSRSPGLGGREGISRHDSGRGGNEGHAGREGNSRYDGGLSRSHGRAGREGVRSRDHDRSRSPRDRGRRGRRRERDRSRSRSPRLLLGRGRSHHHGRSLDVSPRRSRGGELNYRRTPPRSGSDPGFPRPDRSPTPQSPSDIFKVMLPQFDNEFNNMLEEPIEPLPPQIFNLLTQSNAIKLRAEYHKQLHMEREIHEKLITSTALVLDEHNHLASKEQKIIEGFPSLTEIIEDVRDNTQKERDVLAKIVEVLESMQNATDPSQIQNFHPELADFQRQLDEIIEQRRKIMKQREDLNLRRIKIATELLETVKASKEAEERSHRQRDQEQMKLIGELRVAREKRENAQRELSSALAERMDIDPGC